MINLIYILAFMFFLLNFLSQTTLSAKSFSALRSISAMDFTIPDLFCCSINLYCDTEGIVKRLKINNKEIDGVFRLLKPFMFMEELELNNDSITSINGLNYLKKLKHLSIAGNEISNLDSLSSISLTLEYLNVSYNPIFKMSVIENLINLVELEARSSGLLSFPNLSSLTRLKSLDISNNKIIVVPGLEEIANRLDYLFLAGNPIPCSFLDSYYGQSSQINDKIKSELNCSLECDCNDYQISKNTFAGPICVDQSCFFGSCSIENSALLESACDLSEYSTLIEAQNECCTCDECTGVSFIDGAYQPRKGQLGSNSIGVSTQIRIFDEICD